MDLKNVISLLTMSAGNAAKMVHLHQVQVVDPLLNPSRVEIPVPGEDVAL